MGNRHTYIRSSLTLVLLLTWLGFAGWQWHELSHEREQAELAMDRQCKTAHHLLVSSIVSHRRMGASFDSMVQASLDEIVKSKEIVSVLICDDDTGESLLAAGAPISPTLQVPSSNYQWSGSFDLGSNFGIGGGGGGGGFGSGGGGFGSGGGGFGSGFGSGYGRGRGRGQIEPQASASRFQPGKSYSTIFVLDRSEVDQQLSKATWLRFWLVATAGVILLLLAFAWLATVRLVEARGRERILEAEAEHLREMGQAAAGLAHETRNPLGLVRGWTQKLAQANNDSPEVGEQAQAVIEECDRVTARINQFLAFAKPCRPERQEVDLTELVNELKIILEPDLEGKQLTIEYHAEQPSLNISVDREMFRQALFNLVSNAIAFSPDKGIIQITDTRDRDGQTRIEIADRGPGVRDHNAESLFTPYFTTRDGGTGLGLAIVKRIARAHGWQAGFRPRPGGGSIFWMAEANEG